jgi:hypothetical protein
MVVLYRIDFSSQLSRTLYDTLYQRLLAFGAITGEENVEQYVKTRLAEIQAGNAEVHLLVNVQENGRVNAHCLIKFNRLSPESFEAFCEQLQVDGGVGEEFLKDCEAYVQQFPTVSRIRMLTDEGKFRAFRKKYGYEVVKVVMEKVLKHDVEEE